MIMLKGAEPKNLYEMDKKVLLMICSSKAEIVLHCETRRDKEIFLSFVFVFNFLILEHVFYFRYLLHISDTKLPD